MNHGMVKIDGVVVETCHCGSKEISVKKELLPPSKSITMFRLSCDRCNDGPEIYQFIDSIKTHAKTWNAYMRKKKRG